MLVEDLVRRFSDGGSTPPRSTKRNPPQGGFFFMPSFLIDFLLGVVKLTAVRSSTSKETVYD